MQFSKWLSFAFITSVVLGTAGCGAQDYNSLTPARAQLDTDSHLVITPLDQFGPSIEEVTLIEQANAVAIQRCMSKSRLSYPRAEQDWTARPAMPDRLVGIWTLDQATKYGYAPPPFPSGEAADKVEASLPESWWSTWRQCLADTDQLPLTIAFSTDEQTPLDRAYEETDRAARSTQAWTEITTEWSDCLSKKGIAINDAQWLSVKLTDNEQANIEIAVADVECKLELGTAQRLADIIATYETDYTRRHNAELNEYRATVDDVVEEARAQLNRMQ